jgi:hypothetical protein
MQAENCPWRSTTGLSGVALRGTDAVAKLASRTIARQNDGCAVWPINDAGVTAESSFSGLGL